MEQKKPTTSLIISTYNWPEALSLSLKSVLAQKVLPNEVIIADDGSTVHTKELIDMFKARFPIPIKHIWHEDKGFRRTVILNKAIAESEGNYIIQIDGDVILHPCFVKDHIEAAQNDYFIKGSRAQISKNKSLEILDSSQISFHPFSPGIKHRFNALWLPFFSFLIKTDPSNPNIRGCNMAFWRSDFIQVNGYDNTIEGWGHEDIELAARLININKRKKHLKLAAVCYHIYHEVASRAKEKDNHLFFEKTIAQGRKQAENGYREIALMEKVRLTHGIPEAEQS
ncbi:MULTISPECIES: glycosyltransferase family 2 protein [Olivibacter]|uniref:Glycosyltransferase family 2 protein n=1 Tax=Olivibacter jilunii TaxID=985016 RepID=A0ABW6B6U7_9SPHI|nr:glycosyltransferase family 2 protein [Olivibacter sp. UJ_SKK_5.1]MDX3915818.1 glycosyltransferase family 2 protein [Pseudosphingobacterium sp.]